MRYGELRHVAACTLRHGAIRHVTLRCDTLKHVMVWYEALRDVMVRYRSLRYVAAPYGMSWYVTVVPYGEFRSIVKRYCVIPIVTTRWVSYVVALRQCVTMVRYGTLHYGAIRHVTQRCKILQHVMVLRSVAACCSTLRCVMDR